MQSRIYVCGLVLAVALGVPCCLLAQTADSVSVHTPIDTSIDLPIDTLREEVGELIDFSGQGNKVVAYNKSDVISDDGSFFVFPSSNIKRTTSFAVSKDSKYFAQGSNFISVWNVNEQLPMYEIKTHKNYIVAMQFSQDNRILASGDRDGVLCITDMSTGHLLKTFFVHKGGITSMQFSKDGKFLFTAGRDKIIRVWNVATWTSLRKIVARSLVRKLSLSPDGKYLAICLNQGSFDMYNLNTSHVEISYGGDTSRSQKYIVEVEFFPSGDRYVSVAEDGSLFLWNLRTQAIRQRIDFYKPNSLYHFIFPCPSGDRFITAFFGTNFSKGNLWVWDAHKNEILQVLELRGNKPRFYVDAIFPESTKALFMTYQDTDSQTSDVAMYTIEMSHLLCDN